MTLLHAYFYFRNQQAFQRLLDPPGRGQSAASAVSTSGGKSWNRPSPLSGRPPLDVNARDAQGRTVLHVAATATDPAATEYVRMLLAHPHVNINLQDIESHWTALHRSLYHGNIESAILLLQRPDVETTVKDSEGYTAFDLYNSTIEGTKPDSADKRLAQLFTWGANRNAALGLGDGDDRTYPEQVALRPTDSPPVTEHIDARFSPLHVRQIAMSKLHTVVVTNEGRSNVRLCGFGSGGRLGPGQHTQYSLVPLPQFTQSIVAVAVGQDHTLALTKSGEVYSWGLNRFSQLGYVVEAIEGKRSDEPIQATARKITGPLKNKQVKGIAACKTASVSWTDREVFTWGTNSGQLGYDKSAHPVQIVPRVVAKVSQPVISCTITDSMLACLLISKDVVCIWNDGHFKLNFPAYTFPSEITVYRPPQAINNTSIEKITSCDNMLAALSTNGELFTWTAPSPPDGASGSSKPVSLPQPQRVWALRKQYSAVTDVALGADGSLAVCTEAGHVFVRSRNLKAGQAAGAKTFKFQRAPFLQRVVEVCANSTGAYGALRVDFAPEPIKVVGNTIAQDLAAIQPFITIPGVQDDLLGGRRRPGSVTSPAPGSPQDSGPVAHDESEDEGEDTVIQKDIAQLRLLCTLLDMDKQARRADGHGIFSGAATHGADIIIQAQSFEFPAHRVILAARSSVLEGVLLGKPSVDEASQLSVKLSPSKPPSLPKVVFNHCQPLTVLILVSYLYSDEVLALWDGRVGTAIPQLAHLKIKPAQVKTELLALAYLLNLRSLTQAAEPPVKRTPVPSMASDLRMMYEASQAGGLSKKRIGRQPLAPDVTMQFADEEVHTHSALLRSRSPFFAAFFDGQAWTEKRRSPDGTLEIQFKHMRWRAVEPVMRFLCCGEDTELFAVLDKVHNVDELLDYMFDVIAVANELLLDRLVLICAAVILKHAHIANVCYMLSDASHYHVMPLVRSLHSYMAANMDLLLESRMLDDMTPDLIRKLSVFIRQQQQSKYPTSRSTKLIDKAVEKHKDWLILQDIPSPIIPTHRPGPFRDSAKLSPPASIKRDRPQSHGGSQAGSPIIRPQVTQGTNTLDDGVFMMDEPEILPSPVQTRTESRPSPVEPALKPGGWKAVSSTPRVDMRAIMAEAQTKQMPSNLAAPTTMQRTSSGQQSPARAQAAPGARPSQSASQRSASDSPWRNVQQAVPTMTPSTSPHGSALVGSRAGVSTETPLGSTPAGSTPGTPRILSTPSPRKTPVASGLGPVFAPSKQTTPSKGSSSTPRRTTSGSAWTLPPVQPVVQPSAPRPVLSFAEIQQLQAEQGSPAKDKRSLREIQEEERALQAEADFLKWWTAEEERIKAEEAQRVHALPGAPKQRKSKPPKGKVSAVSEGTSSHSDAKNRRKDRSDVPGQGGRPRKPRSPKNSEPPKPPSIIPQS